MRGSTNQVSIPEFKLPVFRSVGGLVEQSRSRSECVSSDRALHSEAEVVSC